LAGSGLGGGIVLVVVVAFIVGFVVVAVVLVRVGSWSLTTDCTEFEF
jgi:hypothetical protein